MSNIILSICIPTFQRAPFIKNLLESIIEQLNSQVENEVEVVISDNASNDGTEQIVFNFKDKIKNLTYFCWDKNMGYDRNLVKVVELAKGYYCWLMGSDDLLNKKSLSEIIIELKKNNYDVITFDRVDMNQNMTEVIGYSSPVKLKRSFTFDTKNKKELIYYLKSVDNMMGFFTYISSIIVKKEVWNSVKNYENFYGTEYIHLFFMLSILKKGAILRYINKPYVICRMHDEGIETKGILFRVQTDNDAFFSFIKHIFKSNSREYKIITKKLVLNLGCYPLLLSKLNPSLSGETFRVFNLCIKYYWQNPHFWLKSILILFMPKFLLKLLYFNYRKYKNIKNENSSSNLRPH